MTLDHESRVFDIDDNGRQKKRSGFNVPISTEVPTVIMVNGFDFDPTEEGEDNPHQALFKDEWRPEIGKFADPDWDVFGFGWYSAELEHSSWAGTLLHGRWNPYRWGWDLAERAGGILAKTIGWDEGLDRPTPKQTLPDVYIIAHSLGSRVALEALGQLQPNRVKRMLLLNGAEYSQTAKRVSAYSEAEVLNITVDTDDVLQKMGTVFAPEAFISSVVGRSGIMNPPDRWFDIQLDDRKLQKKALAAGYEDIRGNNPKKYMDHCYSYLHKPNWRLFGDFVSGEQAIGDLRSSLS